MLFVEAMKLRIVDTLSPEDAAMLQALYSRSAESVDVHIDKVIKVGSGKFMSQFYVGYGHKSIADCGTTTMFIEGVSLLAAKAIQDWPLYSGQETSTRYIDMGKQAIIDPLGTPSSKVILDRWMNFYRENQTRVVGIIRNRYPIREGEKVETYDRAVKARAFDVLRGFLPAGITTQLSWHSNLRQAGDHLAGLVHHPADEIRAVARSLRELLGERYPSSGGGLSLASVSGVGERDAEANDRRLEWEKFTAKSLTYPNDCYWSQHLGDDRMVHSFGQRDLDLRYAATLASRPRGCVLPHFMTDLGQATFEFLLDFGSFRDLQRHRNGVVRMPLLETAFGFEPWYLRQLDEERVLDLHAEASNLIAEQQDAIDALDATSVEKQYYTALGFRVPCKVTMALPALLYFLELRSSKTVHPTLRARVLEMAKRFTATYPDVALHVDLDPDDWDVRRGNQTITERA